MPRKVIQINKNPVYEIGMIATVFGEDTDFDGELEFDKSLEIDGKFRGEIVSEKGFLVIGEKADVKANIRAATVLIKGHVTGNIEATERLEIHPGGGLYGNIRTAKLKIADGVVFEGKCEMIRDAKKPEKGNDEVRETA